MRKVFSHIDADGIMSALIVSRYVGDTKVVFPPFNMFGITDEMLNGALKQDIYVLDLGTDDNLELLIKRRDEFNEINLVDHHTIRNPEILGRAIDAGITVVHDYDMPTSLLTYLHFSNHKKDIISERYAIIGTFGDCMEGTETASTILNRIRKGNEKLFEVRSGAMFTNAVSFAACINAPRRMYYHDGAMFAYNTIKNEVGENIMDVIEGIYGTRKEVEYPNFALLEHWKRFFRMSSQKIFKAVFWGVIEGTDKKLMLGIVNHTWDISGWMASVGSGVYKTPCLVLNTGTPFNYTFSARKPEYKLREEWMNEVDFDTFFSNCEIVSDGLVTGGGHKDASGGGAPLGMELDKISDVIVQVWKDLVG